MTMHQANIRDSRPPSSVRWRGCLLLYIACLLPFAFASSARAETLTLAQCLRETVEHNPLIVREHAAIDQAFAARLILRARALPVLTIGGLAGQLEREDTGMRVPVGGGRFVTTQTTDSSSLIALGTETLYQPLFDAAIPASYRRGTAGVLAEQENLYVVATAQLHLARTLFLQTLFQQKSGEVLRDADAVLAADVQSQNQLASAGLAGRASLLAAQVQRANFNPGLLLTTGTYKTNLAQLLQAMGREPGTHGKDALADITLAGTLGEPFPAFDAAEANRRALERRPDLRNLRALIHAYKEDVNIARAGYYPLVRLYLNGEAVPQSSVRNNTPDAVRASDQVNVTEIRPGIDENWAVIDTGTVRGGVLGAQATHDGLVNSLSQLERNIPSDLAVVRARRTDAQSTVAALQGSVGTAQNTLNIIQAGVAQGTSSQLEFLDAQGGILQIRNSLLAANLELSLAHAEFDRITGNYLQFVNDQPTQPAKK